MQYCYDGLCFAGDHRPSQSVLLGVSDIVFGVMERVNGQQWLPIFHDFMVSINAIKSITYSPFGLKRLINNVAGGLKSGEYLN